VLFLSPLDASPSLPSGAHAREPVARNDDSIKHQDNPSFPITVSAIMHVLAAHDA
jgi:hypothetical protein